MCRARLRASESPDDAVVVVFHWPAGSNVKLLLGGPLVVVVVAAAVDEVDKAVSVSLFICLLSHLFRLF